MGTPHHTKKEIKVLAIETLIKKRKNPLTGEMVCSHSSVDFARLVQPIKALNGVDGFKTDVIYEYPLELDKLDWWERKIKGYDIIFLTYLDNPIFYSALKIICNKYGVLCVIDVDDHIWAVDKHHYLYDQYKIEYDAIGRPRFSEGLYKRTVILRDTDYVTTTNQFLKYRVVEFVKRTHDTIAIMPNYIDLSLYDYKKLKPKTTKEFVISYSEGASHWVDLHNLPFAQSMTTILRKYPNVVFRTTGFYPELKTAWGRRYQFRPQRLDVYKWINDLWTDIAGDCDIVIAPLTYTPYSRAKSYIKYLEYSAAKRAGVYQNIDPYQDIVKDGENGFMAGKYEEWVEKMSILIENEAKRKELAENAYKTILDHQIKDGVSKYADFFRKIIDN